MCLQGATDAILCRGFPGTLKGAASNWFRSYKKGDIQSFDQLVDLFLNKFGNQKRIPKTRAHLLTLKQKPEESLMDYVDKFKRETIGIVGATEEMQIMAFQYGVKSGRFSFDLGLNPPRTMNELYARAEKYFQADEQEKKKRGEGEGREGNKRKNEGDHGAGGSSQKKGRVQDRLSISLPLRRRSPDPPKFYTPLNTTPAQILAVIENEPYLRRPGPMRSDPEVRNKDRWCHFHRDHGHDTNECIQLKRALEDLIQRGYLEQFIAWDYRRRPPPRQAGGAEGRDRGPPREEKVVGNTEQRGRLVIH